MVTRGMEFATHRAATEMKSRRRQETDRLQQQYGVGFQKLRRKAAKQLMEAYDVDDNDVLDAEVLLAHAVVQVLIRCAQAALPSRNF